jgi:pectin methylesterase-like acyl-CoA thioesterase
MEEGIMTIRFRTIFFFAVVVCILSSTAFAGSTASNWWLRVDSTNAKPITTGSISALDQSYQGLIINSYTGTTQSYPGSGTTNITNSQRMYPTSGTVGYWPADSVSGNPVVQQKPDRFVQYIVAPLSGTSLSVDTISMCLGDNIGNFKTSVNIWYYVGTDTTNFLTNATKANSSPEYSIGSSTVYRSPIYSFASTPITIPSGSKLYLRVYPMYAVGAANGKYWQISNVTVSGTTSPSIAAGFPVATTTAATYISTTYLTTGGKVWADSGATVTAKGVCWSTSSPATIGVSNYTTDGTGTGSFTSSITGLTANTLYYIRSYATNSTGTSYGNEIMVTTYAAVVVPTVTTNTVSSIGVHTALSGGKITDWGGADITAKGLCWSTSANPTLVDNNTNDGTGIAAFTRSMSGLSATTLYHVRAYATNGAGTGYGFDSTFTTATASKDSTVIVAKDGSGDYTRVCDALRKVPANYTGKWTIFVKKGIYFERDTLLATSFNVNLIGEDRDSTVITNWIYSDYNSSGNPGTGGTYTFLILGFDFVAKNITFQNTYWPNRWGVISGTQAVAVMTNGGDRHEFINCAFRGYQDTYYAGGGSATTYGRAYFKNCLITGTVDYIFGRGVCVFDSCTTLTMSNAGTSITASSTESTAKYGLVFRNCALTADTNTVAVTDSCGYSHNAVTSFYLGRPWQGSPRAVFIYCNEPSTLATAGWTTMSTNPTLFAEYNCIGAGAATERGTVVGWPLANQARQLTYTEALTYSLTTIYAKNSSSSTNITYDWMPTNAATGDNMPFVVTSVGNTVIASVPRELNLSNNYPNPFNPLTQIQFSVPKDGHATLKVYNLIGQEVATLFDGVAKSGQSIAKEFSGNKLASGVYFARLQFNGASRVQRMLLLK